MAHANELWPEIGRGPEPKPGSDGWEIASSASDRPAPDLSRLGLLLCFASAVLTLIGIGSALERIFS